MLINNRPNSMLHRNVWNLLGLPIDAVTLEQTVEIIEQSIENKTRCFLSTPNLNFVIQSLNDQIFYNSILASNLVVADGMPIIWIAKLLGIPFKERVAGSSLFETIRFKYRKKLIRVFFFGGDSNVAERAAININRESKGMTACGFLNPGTGTVETMSTGSVLQEINQAEPDFLVVSLGAKKGQQWILKNHKKLNATVISHLGAVVNFVAGDVKRAPVKLQNIGLEWLWRIYQEPNLWIRYFNDGWSFIKLVLFKIIPLFSNQMFIKLISNKKHLNTFSTKLELSGYELSKLCINGFAIDDKKSLIKSDLQNIIKQQSKVVIDCSKLKYIDSSIIGLLVVMKAELIRLNGSLKLINVSKRVLRILNLHSVSGFLLEDTGKIYFA